MVKLTFRLIHLVYFDNFHAVILIIAPLIPYMIRNGKAKRTDVQSQQQVNTVLKIINITLCFGTY